MTAKCRLAVQNGREACMSDERRLHSGLSLNSENGRTENRMMPLSLTTKQNRS